MASQYPYPTPTYTLGAATVWPMATPTPQWPQESWERSPAGVVPPPKWTEVDNRTKDKDKKERDRDKKKTTTNSTSTSVNNVKAKKEKEVEKEKVEEESKPLDLDTRIALLLKEKGGGMAPAFLSLGDDSDDESKAGIDKSLNSVPIPTSIDSDDDRSSISLSDMPINPPAPDMDDEMSNDVEEKLPLSVPPSPFLTMDVYLECHRQAIEFVRQFFYHLDFFVMFCMLGFGCETTRRVRNDGIVQESPSGCE